MVHWSMRWLTRIAGRPPLDELYDVGFLGMGACPFFIG